MGRLDAVIEAALQVEGKTGVRAAALVAVAMVETNGVAYALFQGRREPLIRFEGHCFDRLLVGDSRRKARAEGLADPAAGRVRNPAAQSARWRLLGRAADIDAGAAHAATSWGLGQVMGAHWKLLGFDGPSAMAARARHSAEGQLDIVARFLKAESLDQLLPRGAFAAFARRYNGPGYLRNRYDAKIAAAFAEAETLVADIKGAALPLVAGARGQRVAALQQDLVRHGFAVVVDGIFGPATAKALLAFEASKALCVRAAPVAASGSATHPAARDVDATVSKGWLRPPAMLSNALSWLSLHPSARTRTPSSSISTEPSSASPTIRRPSASPPPS